MQETPYKRLMSRTKPTRRSACPISYALDFFGDKWTLLVVRDLMFGGKRRYGEFLNSDEAIATNILADRLAKLENAGIIRKSADPQTRARNVYRLTDKGLDLIPVMLELVVWGAKHDPQTGAPKAFIRRYKTDRENVVKEIRDRLAKD